MLLTGRGEEVCEGARRDIGDRAVADLLRVKIVKIRRHLVEKDEDRSLTVEEVKPVLLIGCLRTGRPEFPKCVALAELLGNFSPEEVVGVVAPVKGGDSGAIERVDV